MKILKKLRGVPEKMAPPYSLVPFSRCTAILSRNVFSARKNVSSVEALPPDDPRSCQMDARFQPR